MKRMFVFICFVFVLCGISSCTKEDVISGTKWLGGEGGSTMELRFTKTDFELKEVNRNEMIIGNYVYEAPNITFIATTGIDSFGNVKYGGSSFTGLVDGKVLTIYNDGMTAKFIKQ